MGQSGKYEPVFGIKKWDGEKFQKEVAEFQKLRVNIQGDEQVMQCVLLLCESNNRWFPIVQRPY